MLKLFLNKLGLKAPNLHNINVSSPALKEERRWKRIISYPSRKLLAILGISLCSYPVVANQEVDENTEDFVKGVSDQAINMNLEHILQIAKESKLVEDLKPYLSDTRLVIFVSSSMSLELLKAYAEEASKYGAMLVFKGLPEGSFKELRDLITKISAGRNLSIQIDEEAFDKYSVSVVPAIVLSMEEECFSGQSCALNFDKITGNIGIHAALEKFSHDGELASLAGEILHHED